ncbi:hypothetical protein JSY17_16420 [Pseudomonas capsici]|uniref:hypothetical protein n=1 Tax=Pseudomonas capsici TaxID=2810614 RepID=UPI001910897D|nr:hypothetical protein [Pseudomonas capsici]MBN6715581.1 hypothetical protein [Pseudomonas capsici]MBN6720702.1 hypothetical protein [Pseudomonas capsici]MBN6725544.1 hypothetical protein [Pseudomonas capsici]GFM60186.1 hypothetical protein PSCICG_13460 [Pseudomonas cichorii]
MFKKAIALLLLVPISGCSYLNPEREMISKLKGKDIAEAKGFLYSSMGDPVYEPTPIPSIIADTIPADSERLYQWETLVYYEDVPEQTGSYMDVNMGRPILVHTYDYKRVNHYCTVSLKSDRRGIVQSAEAVGSGCTRLSKSWFFGI